MDIFARTIEPPQPIPGIEISWERALTRMSRNLAVTDLILEIYDDVEDLFVLCEPLMRLFLKNEWLYFDTPGNTVEPVEMCDESLPLLFSNGSLFFRYAGFQYSIYI